jgi:uncharacterized protein (DUF2141 family)
MHRVLITALTFALGLLIVGPGQADEGHRVTVTVTDVPSADGSILVALFGPEGFPSAREAAQRAIAPASKGTMTVHVEGVPTGHWAIAVFHDANGDGELTTNRLGMPIEAYGFGNDARSMFGPPKWD